MAAPYSMDLRERVATAIAGGMSRRAAAAHFLISVSTAIRWAKRVRETGSPAPLPMGGRRPFTLASEADWLTARFTEKPDITLRELLAELRLRGIEVSYYGLWNMTDRLGLSFKKNSTRQRTGSAVHRPTPRAMEAAARQH
jgi:putative transposase